MVVMCFGDANESRSENAFPLIDVAMASSPHEINVVVNLFKHRPINANSESQATEPRKQFVSRMRCWNPIMDVDHSIEVVANSKEVRSRARRRG